MTIARDTFQSDYESAVRGGHAPDGAGQVVDYYGRIDRMGGVLLVVEFNSGRKLSPYYNQSPEADELEDVENAPHEWADSMSGAAEWDTWDWVETD